VTGKLTALAVTRAKERGTYGDGGGLYLQVARGGTKSWILRFKRDGKTRHLGLGSLSIVSLREARQRAINARRLLLDGQDPIERKFALASAETSNGFGAGVGPMIERANMGALALVGFFSFAASRGMQQLPGDML
jgi:hypothetical protein